nr:uncharacterized protein LOC111419614 [Onthophagus taurus]
MKNDVPNEIIVGNTCREINENINTVWNLLRNDVTVQCYKFPCKTEENFYIKIKSWIQEVKKQRNTANFQILYFLAKIFTLFPQILMNSFITVSVKKTCLAFTNIPGPDSGKIGDINVEKSFLFVNHFGGPKFGLTLFSFNGKLHATLISDKQTNINREDLQQILNNSFKKIDELLEIKNK